MIEKNFKIASYDVGPNDKLRMSALQKYMQQLAREDCDACGATYKAMRDENMVFVLTKLGTESYKKLYAEDDITIKTYNDHLEGVHFVRAFEIYKDGELAAASTTYWVLINYATRGIIRPKNFHFDMEEHKLCNSFVDIPRRIFSFENPESEPVLRAVVYSDLDQNNHLNNCVYSDIALDYSPVNPSEIDITALHINFTNEAHLGDILEIHSISSGSSLFTKAYNKTLDRPCFESEIRYNSK